MYLHRHGWTDQRQFSIRTVAGEIRPTILDETRCRVDMGRAKLRSAKDFPSGGPDGQGEIGGRAFQFVSIGNPQCAIAVDDLDGRSISPPSARASSTARCFRTARTSRFYAPLERAHDPRADLRARGGRDAVQRDRGHGRRGRARAARRQTRR